MMDFLVVNKQSHYKAANGFAFKLRREYQQGPILDSLLYTEIRIALHTVLHTVLENEYIFVL